MKKILITGASGFIGSFLVEEALKQGWEVWAGIRLTSIKTYLTNPAIHFIELDFSNEESMKELFVSFKRKSGTFDAIVHNAGITKTHKKHDFDLVNHQYTRNLINALILSGSTPKKFVYISSLAAFGPGNAQSGQPITSKDTPNPITYYGKSKLRAEQYISSLTNFPYLILRPTGVYGPREKDYLVMYKTINKHLETYIGTAFQQLTFLYIKDLARIIIAASASNISNKSYFITDGNKYTTKEFSAIVKAHLNKKTITLVFPKAIVKSIAWSLEKLYAFFGSVPTLNTEKYKEISCTNWLCEGDEIWSDHSMEPKYDLKSGLKETIDWYKQEKML
ncbi:MAG: NAD(P)-dependent oxidoreductase [Bacteroidetes bacterium]|nr:NAD(P)-dependent oxidoreductase [Bacteroidota bacterium]